MAVYNTELLLMRPNDMNMYSTVHTLSVGITWRVTLEGSSGAQQIVKISLSFEILWTLQWKKSKSSSNSTPSTCQQKEKVRVHWLQQ